MGRHKVWPVAHKDVADYRVAVKLVEACAQGEGCPTLVVVDHGKLPTAEQVLPSRATGVQEFLSGTDRQFIHPRHGEHVGLVIIAYGPFCVGIGRVQTSEIER